MEEGGSINEGAAPAGASPPVTGPRFPWAAALFCAACVGAAAWTWMRYSYCWHVPTALIANHVDGSWPEGAYARFVLSLDDGSLEIRAPGNAPVPCSVEVLAEPYVLGRGFEEDLPELALGDRAVACRIHVFHDSEGYWYHATDEYSGLMTGRTVHGLRLDKAASRLHGASIAGLVVGAMGIFVFGLYLRTWVKDRRAGQDGCQGAQ